MRRSRKPSDDSDSDDERKEKSKKTAQQQQRQQRQQRQSDRNVDNWTHLRRRNAYYNDNPSKTELKTLADHLHSKVSEKNNDPLFVFDATADTITVGLSNNEELIVSGNVKQRGPTDSRVKGTYVEVKKKDGTKLYMEYRNYGITKEVAEVILPEVKGSDVYKKSPLGVKIIEQNLNPKDDPNLPTMLDKAYDNASKHAEMKTLAYCEKNGWNLWKLQSIGISKEACPGCHENLTKLHVEIMPEKEGTKRVKNWREVGEDEVGLVLGVDRRTEIKADFHFLDNNILLSTKKFTRAVKNNVKRSIRIGACVGLISGAAQIVIIIEKGTAKPYADGGFMNYKSGFVPGILGGQTYYARAAVAEGRTGLGDVVSIGASVLSAGAFAQYGCDNSIGFYASVVRVDGNLGPVQVGAGLCFDTHASVGVNGVSASLLGIGFSLGPRIGIQTPFFDVNVTLV